MRCYVSDCPSKSHRDIGVSFHGVPVKENLRLEWCKSLGMKQIYGHDIKKAFICSKHFDKNCIVKLGSRTHLLPNAIPVYRPPPTVKIHCLKATKEPKIPLQAKCVPEKIRPPPPTVKIHGLKVTKEPKIPLQAKCVPEEIRPPPPMKVKKIDLLQKPSNDSIKETRKSKEYTVPKSYEEILKYVEENSRSTIQVNANIMACGVMRTKL